MPVGVTFYFVRHGETWFNRAGRIQGWADSPLTPEGIAGVKKTAQLLSGLAFDYAYASDLKRAIDSAQLLLDVNHYADNLVLETMPEFREVRFGYFEGMLAQDVRPLAAREIALKHPEVDIERSPHLLLNAYKRLDPYGLAESFPEFWERVEAGIIYLLERHRGSEANVLVVAHGQTIRHTLHALVPELEMPGRLHNGSISRVQYINGQFRLLGYNELEVNI